MLGNSKDIKALHYILLESYLLAVEQKVQNPFCREFQFWSYLFNLKNQYLLVKIVVKNFISLFLPHNIWVVVKFAELFRTSLNLFFKKFKFYKVWFIVVLVKNPIVTWLLDLDSSFVDYTMICQLGGFQQAPINKTELRCYVLLLNFV